MVLVAKVMPMTKGVTTVEAIPEVEAKTSEDGKGGKGGGKKKKSLGETDKQ